MTNTTKNTTSAIDVLVNLSFAAAGTLYFIGGVTVVANAVAAAATATVATTATTVALGTVAAACGVGMVVNTCTNPMHF